MAAVPGFDQQLEQSRQVGPNLPDLLQALQVERRSLVAILGALTPEDWERETPCPGWAVHDLVLHLLGGPGRPTATRARGAGRPW